MVGKQFRCQFGNVVPYLFVQALRMPRSKKRSGAYRPKYTNKTHFSLVSLSVYPRSRRGAERIRQGEGHWSRPPKTALKRSYLTENSSSENHILRPRRKQTPDRIPEKGVIIYMYLFRHRGGGVLNGGSKGRMHLALTTFPASKYGNQISRIVGTFGKRLLTIPTKQLVGDLSLADSQLQRLPLIFLATLGPAEMPYSTIALVNRLVGLLLKDPTPTP